MDALEERRVMGNLAVMLRELGDPHGARALGEEVLAELRELLGPSHPDTLKAMGNLAITLRQLGDLHGARALEEELRRGRVEAP